MPRHHAGAEALNTFDAADAARQLEAALQIEWPGLRCEWVASIPSSNTELVERSRSGLFEPTVLITDEQTQGRGRLGRQWKSAPGASLTFSIALPLSRPDWAGLSLAIGVALVEALAPASTEQPDPASASRPALRLKWPNDLWLVDGAQGDLAASRSTAPVGRKLGGILIEGLSAAGHGRVAVIGIGLNLLPLAATAQMSSGYASLSELQSSLPTRSQELGQVLPAVLRAVGDFDRSGFAAFAKRFAKLDLLEGRAVRTLKQDGSERPGAAGAATDPTSGSLDGIASGVDSSGALLVRTPGGMRTVSSGEVSVRLAVTACAGADVPHTSQEH